MIGDGLGELADLGGSADLAADGWAGPENDLGVAESSVGPEESDSQALADLLAGESRALGPPPEDIESPAAEAETSAPEARPGSAEAPPAESQDDGSAVMSDSEALAESIAGESRALRERPDDSAADGPVADGPVADGPVAAGPPVEDSANGDGDIGDGSTSEDDVVGIPVPEATPIEGPLETPPGESVDSQDDGSAGMSDSEALAESIAGEARAFVDNPNDSSADGLPVEDSGTDDGGMGEGPAPEYEGRVDPLREATPTDGPAAIPAEVPAEMTPETPTPPISDEAPPEVVPDDGGYDGGSVPQPSALAEADEPSMVPETSDPRVAEEANPATGEGEISDSPTADVVSDVALSEVREEPVAQIVPETATVAESVEPPANTEKTSAQLEPATESAGESDATELGSIGQAEQEENTLAREGPEMKAAEIDAAASRAERADLPPAESPPVQADSVVGDDMQTPGEQRESNDGPIDHDAVSVKPDGSPWPESPLCATEPLPRLDEAAIQRSEEGLIESVDGKSVRDYVSGLATERTQGYLDARQDGTVAKSEVAPVTSVLLDTRTGRVYEAVNQERVIPTDLHPILQERLDSLVAEAAENPEAYQYRNGDKGGFPHFDIPGRHAEVLNTSRALYDREAMGYQVTPESLSEMIVDNRFPYRPPEKTAPCCPNCTAILEGIDSIPGMIPADEWKRGNE